MAWTSSSPFLQNSMVVPINVFEAPTKMWKVPYAVTLIKMCLDETYERNLMSLLEGSAISSMWLSKVMPFVR